MKTTILSIISMILFSATPFAQNVNIPDANFKAYLVGNTSINTNSDSEIQVSEATAFTGQIDCGYLNISDLTGIEAFTSLTELRCYGNNIATLDVSQNSALEYLHCGYNAQLTSLITGSITSLTNLNTTNSTSLFNLDISQNTSLTNVDLTENDLFSLDVSQNTALTNLNINFNNISSIDLSQNTVLNGFSCFNNSLNSLDVSACTLISSLHCGGNNLTSLDVSALPSLYNFSCHNNNLTSLVVSNNPILYSLICEGNNITQLDVSQNTDLINLICSSNNLTSLNMKNLSTSTLSNFDATSNPNLTCIEVDDVADATANWTDIDATATFSLDCNSGINESILNSKISVYPNPSKSSLFVEGLESNEHFNIINLQGEIVYTGRTNNNISLNNLASGTYILKFDDRPVILFVKE